MGSAAPRSRTGATRRPIQGLGRCRRGVVALEFVIVVTPLLMAIFGSIGISAVLFTQSSMQDSAQYAAMLVATGQVTNLTTGALSSSNTTATAQCSSSLTSNEAEYYACSGLPSWAAFTVTTTENCATPSVTVTISANASQAAIVDVFNVFSGDTVQASSAVMKQGTCP